jgi:hypothetical protein
MPYKNLAKQKSYAKRLNKLKYLEKISKYKSKYGTLKCNRCNSTSKLTYGNGILCKSCLGFKVHKHLKGVYLSDNSQKLKIKRTGAKSILRRSLGKLGPKYFKNAPIDDQIAYLHILCGMALIEMRKGR